MNNNDNLTISRLNNLIDQIISGKLIINNLDEINESENEALKELTDKIYSLGKQYNESYQFVLDLSKGKLNTDPPKRNSFVNAYKQLHSELLHLTWQIKEVANGDYDQNVSFSGDFSDAINKMIVALREKQQLGDINKENEQLFQTIFNTSPDGMLICDLESKVLDISYSGMDMFMLSNEDVNKQFKLKSLFSDEDLEKLILYCKNILLGNQAESSEYKVHRKDSSVI